MASVSGLIKVKTIRTNLPSDFKNNYLDFFDDEWDVNFNNASFSSVNSESDYDSDNG